MRNTIVKTNKNIAMSGKARKLNGYLPHCSLWTHDPWILTFQFIFLRHLKYLYCQRKAFIRSSYSSRYSVFRLGLPSSTWMSRDSPFVNWLMGSIYSGLYFSITQKLVMFPFPSDFVFILCECKLVTLLNFIWSYTSYIFRLIINYNMTYLQRRCFI